MISRAAAVLLFLAIRSAAASADSFLHAKTLEDSGKNAEARPAFEQIVREKSAKPGDQALALVELSRMDLSAGSYTASVARGQDAASRLYTLKDFTSQGNVLTITGLARMYSGNYEAALSDFETALKISRDTADRKQEVTRLNNIGNVLYFQGRYADALEVLQGAMKLVDHAGSEDWSAARRQLTAANIAIVYQSLGQYDRALDTYSGISAFSDDFKPQERAQLLSNMGALYRRLGDPVKAMETYRAAQQLYRQRGLKRGEIAVLNNIGTAQALDMHQLEAAVGTFDEALRLAADSNDRLVGLQSLLFRAEALYRLRRLKASRGDFEKASALADAIHASEEKWKALYGLAQLARQDGDSKQAVSMLREAVGIIESLRGSGPAGLLGGFLADKRQVYDLLIGELAGGTNPDPEDIFRTMELSRARTLQDLTKASGAVVSLAQTGRTLPDDSVLVEYWLGDDSLVALWVSHRKSGVVFKRERSGLRAALRNFHSKLGDSTAIDWEGPAASVAEELLGGREGALSKQLSNPGSKNLIIVPDREISLIPVDALPLPGTSGLRVLDRYAVSYLPAASLLHGQGPRRSVFPFWRRTVLALGDPAPNTAAGSFAMPSARDARRLPFAAAEVRSVAEIVGGRVSLFTGSEASKENLKRGLRSGFPIVHLATHAFTDPEDSARSYILLAGASRSQGYDYLFLNEIRNLKLPGVDLVTLSACETETGKLVEGEGTASFSRAFLGAGARAVITSLWPVADKPAAELMDRFYSAMASGTPAAESLRRAKSELAAAGYQHPFYWAAFVLNGEPGLAAPLVLGWTVILGGVFGTAGVSLLVWSWIKRRQN